MKNLNTQNKLTRIIFFVGLLSLTAFAGCNDKVENPNPPNQEELITTVILSFEPIQGGAGKISASWKDLDGPGGNPPGQIDDILLENASFYSLTVEFLNESESPPDDITAEIRTEGDEHQLFFTGSAFNSGLVQHQYDDQDVNGNPLGLINQIITQTAGSGTFIVTLKHQPEVKTNSTGINDGDTDIEVAFNIMVQ